MKKLSELLCGEQGTIESIKGNNTTTGRLMTMALLPGELVEVLRIAPLGDPITIKLRQSQLSLRKQEAACVIISS